MNCNDNLFTVKQPSSIDIKAIPLDDSLIRKELKWKAKIPIKKGINKTINYITNNFEKLKKEKINFKIN